jgi:hypothetical protein
VIIAVIASGCSEREEIVSGVILDSEQLASGEPALLAGLEASAPYWTPTAEQASLAAAVLDHLRRMNTTQSRQISDAIGEYKRQYVGYTADGKQWMLVNAMCRDYWEKQEIWKLAVVLVFDGGTCFFRARFEMATSMVRSLEINGDA